MSSSALLRLPIDPDGNYVQIIQMSEEHLAAMERGGTGV